VFGIHMGGQRGVYRAIVVQKYCRVNPKNICSADGSTHTESNELYREVKPRARPNLSSRQRPKRAPTRRRSRRRQRRGELHTEHGLRVLLLVKVNHPDGAVKRSTGQTHTHTTAEQTTHTNTERATAQRRLIIVEVVVAAPKLPPSAALLLSNGAVYEHGESRVRHAARLRIESIAIVWAMQLVRGSNRMIDL